MSRDCPARPFTSRFVPRKIGPSAGRKRIFAIAQNTRGRSLLVCLTSAGTFCPALHSGSSCMDALRVGRVSTVRWGAVQCRRTTSSRRSYSIDSLRDRSSALEKRNRFVSKKARKLDRFLLLPSIDFGSVHETPEAGGGFATGIQLGRSPSRVRSLRRRPRPSQEGAKVHKHQYPPP